MMATYLPTGEKRLIETHRSSVESGKKGALARAMVTVARAFEVSKPVEGPAE